MSLAPYDDCEPEVLVGKTDLGPISRDDEPGVWRRFLDTLRMMVGFKPLYLCERWAEAKVAVTEIDNQVKLLNARKEFELASAEAYRVRTGADGQAKKDQAEAKFLDAKAQSLREATARQKKLTARLLEPKTPREAAEDLLHVIRQIEYHGGTVEIPIPPPGHEVSDPEG